MRHLSKNVNTIIYAIFHIYFYFFYFFPSNFANNNSKHKSSSSVILYSSWCSLRSLVIFLNNSVEKGKLPWSIQRSKGFFPLLSIFNINPVLSIILAIWTCPWAQAKCKGVCPPSPTISNPEGHCSYKNLTMSRCPASQATWKIVCSFMSLKSRLLLFLWNKSVSIFTISMCPFRTAKWKGGNVQLFVQNWRATPNFLLTVGPAIKFPYY